MLTCPCRDAPTALPELTDISLSESTSKGFAKIKMLQHNATPKPKQRKTICGLTYVFRLVYKRLALEAGDVKMRASRLFKM
jgi:hypothetical protein